MSTTYGSDLMTDAAEAFELAAEIALTSLMPTEVVPIFAIKMRNPATMRQWVVLNRQEWKDGIPYMVTEPSAPLKDPIDPAAMEPSEIDATRHAAMCRKASWEAWLQVRIVAHATFLYGLASAPNPTAYASLVSARINLMRVLSTSAEVLKRIQELEAESRAALSKEEAADAT